MVQIKTTAKDFEDFLSNRLKVFPIYLATTEKKQWLFKKNMPEILDENVEGSQLIELNKPLVIRKEVPGILRSSDCYRDQVLDLLMNWLMEIQEEFQILWRNVAVNNEKQTVDYI